MMGFIVGGGGGNNNINDDYGSTDKESYNNKSLNILTRRDPNNIASSISSQR